jgi:hypothetical protein
MAEVQAKGNEREYFQIRRVREILRLSDPKTRCKWCG